MHTATVLTTTALAGLALANPVALPLPQITVAPLHANAHLARNSQPRDLSPREFSLSLDGALQTSCALDLIGIASRMPTATKDVQEWLATAMPSIVLTEDEQFTPQLTSECAGFDLAKITPPATLSSAYSSFLSQATSWLSENSASVSKRASECGGMPSAMMELLIASDEESCTKAVGGIVKAYYGTNSVPGQTTSENVGPRETGMVGVAVAAVVGAVGVVAAL